MRSNPVQLSRLTIPSSFITSGNVMSEDSNSSNGSNGGNSSNSSNGSNGSNSGNSNKFDVVMSKG